MFFNLVSSPKVCLPVDNCRTSSFAPPSITSVSPFSAAAIVIISSPPPALIVSMPSPPVILSLPASPVIVSASFWAERITSDPPEAVLIVSMFFNLSLSAKVCLPVDNCRTSASAPPSITSVSPLPAAAIVIISSPPAPSILSAPALPVSLSTPAPPVSV